MLSIGKPLRYGVGAVALVGPSSPDFCKRTSMNASWLRWMETCPSVCLMQLKLIPRKWDTFPSKVVFTCAPNLDSNSFSVASDALKYMKSST